MLRGRPRATVGGAGELGAPSSREQPRSKGASSSPGAVGVPGVSRSRLTVAKLCSGRQRWGNDVRKQGRSAVVDPTARVISGTVGSGGWHDRAVGSGGATGSGSLVIGKHEASSRATVTQALGASSGATDPATRPSSSKGLRGEACRSSTSGQQRQGVRK